METNSRVDSTLDQATATSATRVQPDQATLADKLKSLQLANEPDRTQPNPLPVASTSSSPPRSEPDRFDSRPDRAESNEAPPKRKLVLLKRPETPTRLGEGSPSRTAAAPREDSRTDAIGTPDESRLASDAGLRDLESQHAVDEDQGAQADPAALDPVVRGALSHPRDRFLLLRAEVELERFVLNSTISRLPLAPPHFQPGLNSYQRLLIHRLADMFGITREVEPAPPTLWNAGMINPATGQPQGVVVLVKGEAAAIPTRKLASYVPAPEPAPSTVSSPVPHLPIARNSSALSSPAPSPDEASPAASVGASAPPPPPPVFKILPRASRGTSSASSSADVDDDGTSSLGTGSRSRLRRDLTLEEREAAYKEARERIFSKPDPVERSTPAPSTASAASSVAGEDAVSVQSLGYGITRPSSAGSTFSRSSAALSVSGQRPPPSIASDSNPAIRPGYYGGFYQQQQAPPQPPAMGGMPYPMPNLRPAGPPVFDPATGGWTYAPSADYTAASPYSMSYGTVQPPPPPPPMPYQSPPPPVSQFDSGSVATPSAWHRSLPSPTLSGSSGSSYPPPLYHQQQQQQQMQPHVPPAAQRPSSGASGASGSDTGYLMRFPEGAIVTAAGAVVGPPQPYAAVAVCASLRSPSSASLGASSSASRVATRGGTSTGPNSLRRLSQSTTQSLGSVHSYSAPPSDDAASRRSPSATSGAADDSPEASLLGENFSEVGSSVGGEGSAPPSLVSGGSDGKRRGRQTTIVSRGGRAERERSMRPEGEAGGDDDDKARERSMLHPSLPAKPSWAAAAGGSIPTAQGDSSPTVPRTGQAASPSTSRTSVTPSRSAAPVSLRDLPGLATSLRGPPSTASSSPGGPAFPPLSAAAATVGPPPPPPGPGPWSRPNPTFVAQSPGPNSHGGQTNGYPQYAAATPPTGPYPPQQPSSYSAWLSHATQGPPAAHVGYAPTPRHPQLAQMYPPSGLEGGAVPPTGSKPADLMSMPDMRRPPPRSTQLFDPNKPGSSGSMRRVASGAGSARGRP